MFTSVSNPVGGCPYSQPPPASPESLRAFLHVASVSAGPPAGDGAPGGSSVARSLVEKKTQTFVGGPEDVMLPLGHGLPFEHIGAVAPPPPPPQLYPVPVHMPPSSSSHAPPSKSMNQHLADMPSDHVTPKYRRREKVITTDVTWVCPDHFAMAGDECLRYDQKPTKLGCRDGWAFDDYSCKGANVVPPTLECDPGFEEHNGECLHIKVAPKHILCPVGYVLHEDTCLQETTTKPDLVCPDGEPS